VVTDRPRGDGAADITELPLDPGLCGHCHYLRLLRSARSTFVRCGLADVDAGFPRYPPLPMLACPGYRPRDGAEVP
jgi:hypothetical protein